MLTRVCSELKFDSDAEVHAESRKDAQESDFEIKEIDTMIVASVACSYGNQQHGRE